MTDVLITNGTVVTQNRDREVIDPGAVEDDPTATPASSPLGRRSTW